jgi:hypothetical protein
MEERHPLLHSTLEEQRKRLVGGAAQVLSIDGVIGVSG